MKRWQFSLSSMLRSTAAVAIWLWVILLVPGGKGVVLRAIPLVVLCGATVVLQRVTRESRDAWSTAAFWAGATVLMAVFLVALTDDWTILSPIE
jgi:hypothetical protein